MQLLQTTAGYFSIILVSWWKEVLISFVVSSDTIKKPQITLFSSQR